MRKWFLPAIIFVAGILQASLLDAIRIFNFKPDLLLILVVGSSLSLPPAWALILSILAGFMKDLFGLNCFGPDVLLFPLWSLIILRLSRKIAIEGNFRRALLVFFIGLLHNAAARLILAGPGTFIPLGIYLRVLLSSAAYTAAVSPLLFKVFEGIES